MKLAIIAAGEGSRLREEGILTPKPLLKLKGETLLMRHIRRAAKAWIQLSGCNCECYLPRTCRIPRYDTFSLPIEKIVKTTPGSMHSFYELRNFLRDEPFLLTTVDPVFREDAFGRYIDTIKQNPDACGIMALTAFVDDEKPLWVTTDENMKILSYRFSKRRCSVGKCRLLFFYPNCHIPLLEAAMDAGLVRMRAFQQYLLDMGCLLVGCDVGKVIDIDHADDIQKAEELID
jgi:NDP-sugar pyrophosphorylase family protein